MWCFVAKIMLLSSSSSTLLLGSSSPSLWLSSDAALVIGDNFNRFGHLGLMEWSALLCVCMDVCSAQCSLGLNGSELVWGYYYYCAAVRWFTPSMRAVVFEPSASNRNQSQIECLSSLDFELMFVYEESSTSRFPFDTNGVRLSIKANISMANTTCHPRTPPAWCLVQDCTDWLDTLCPPASFSIVVPSSLLLLWNLCINNMFVCRLCPFRQW